MTMERMRVEREVPHLRRYAGNPHYRGCMMSQPGVTNQGRV